MQRNMQAQYFRDPNDLPRYLEHNKFLTKLNNEVIFESQNETYKDNFSSLENLILVMFMQDKTVVPKESSWFGSYAPPEEDEGMGRKETTIIPMRLQPLYTNDLIGLRALDESGRVHLESCDSAHMRLPKDCWEPIVKKYTGGEVGLRSEESFGEEKVLVLQG